MAGGGNPEDGNVNIIPLLDVIFIFIFFLLMSVQFLEYFQLAASNPVQQAPPEDIPKPDENDKSQQFKLRLSKEEIELTAGMEEKVLGTFKYDSSGISNLRRTLFEKKMEFPKENSMIIKPFKDVDFDKIVEVIDCAHQKINPKDKKSEKIFRNIAFESRTE